MGGGLHEDLSRVRPLLLIARGGRAAHALLPSAMTCVRPWIETRLRSHQPYELPGKVDAHSAAQKMIDTDPDGHLREDTEPQSAMGIHSPTKSRNSPPTRCHLAGYLSEDDVLHEISAGSHRAEPSIWWKEVIEPARGNALMGQVRTGTRNRPARPPSCLRTPCDRPGVVPYPDAACQLETVMFDYARGAPFHAEIVPRIAAVAPTRGSMAGGAELTIYGSGFGYATEDLVVRVGETGAACDVSRISEVAIFCRVQALGEVRLKLPAPAPSRACGSTYVCPVLAVGIGHRRLGPLGRYAAATVG